MKLRELLIKGNDALKDVQDAEGDARWLLLDSFMLTDAEYLLKREEEVPEDKAGLYLERIQRRKQNEPVAYILGRWEFMGLDFEVSPDVLIPRQDTETLVERAIELAEDALLDGKGEKYRILDMCTGSGCIAVSTAFYLKQDLTLTAGAPGIEVTATDISKKALDIACRNAQAAGVDIGFCQGDLWDALDPFEGQDPHFDMILSNPPYIDGPQMQTLPRNVREFEPSLALFGGEDGLDIYRRILNGIGDHLVPGGVCLFEIGEEQGGSVSALIEERTDLYVEEVIQDLAGHDRVVQFRKKRDR